MDEYQLLFHSVPTVSFAHRYATDLYDIAHDAAEQRIEITYVLQGNCDIWQEKRQVPISVPVDSIFITVYNQRVHFTAPGYHHHATVGVLADFQHVENNGLILPHVLTFPTPDNPVRPMMEQLILQYNMTPDSPLNQAMVWELLGKISVLYLEAKEEHNFPGQTIYVRRAKKYIHEHLNTPLRISDIAARLSISTGYLSHIFSELEGQTLVEYINTVRIQRVEELVLKYGLEVREAGMMVGLADPDYTSRLFRKIRGCSLTELRRVREKRDSKK
ncbi:MAG: helix-turn-helix transcriptional regulator [Ruminococcaceae bacterium]|nr:helix-turn-helix transcriptional regulator [Oscillospiraceae bacterium]